MKSIRYIKMGFMFYIGYEVAKELDKKYRNKIITIFKNLSNNL